MKANPGLIALSIGAFGIGVTEFAPMGLLPVIAGDLGVSIPTAGLLISAYALGVMLGAPLMTLTTGRVPPPNAAHRARRRLHTWQPARCDLDRIRDAAGRPAHHVAQPWRVFSAWGRSWPPVWSRRSARAGAVAAMFMGLTIANVVGVPLATWAGEHLGVAYVLLGYLRTGRCDDGRAAADTSGDARPQGRQCQSPKCACSNAVRCLALWRSP